MTGIKYRSDIQGLRAIAVLAVIVFHLNPAWLPGGFVGVDIFLVISGFLIATILLQKKSKPEYKLTSTVQYFYTSRIKRIAPAYYTVLIAATLVAAVLFLPADFAVYKDGLENAAYFNSNNFFATFGDYFELANYEQPLLHTWSLAIEIQFYLLAPFIFLLLPKSILSWFLPLGIISLVIVTEYQLRIVGNQQATYYSLIARLPAFLLGAWIALLIGSKNKYLSLEKYKHYLIWLSIGLIALAFSQPKLTGYFPGIASLIPIVGAALIILLKSNNVLTPVLSSKVLVWVGALSYSLYLWHWPVLAFIRYYTGSEILSWKCSVVFIVLTLSLSVASYYLIEVPLRLKRNKKQILGYAFLIFFVLLMAVGMKKLNAYFTTEPLPVELTRYADPNTICHGKIVGDCLKGDLTSDKEVLVLGDSHAAMLNHFFDYLGKELNFKARIITASSCVTIPGFDYQRIAEWAHKSCLSQIEEAKRYIKDAEIIFLAASWNWQLESKVFKSGLNQFLNDTAAKKYILSQEPLLNRNPLRNYRFVNLGLGDKAEVNKDYLRTNLLLKNLAEHNSLSYYLELHTLPMFKAPPYYNGAFIYYDEHHLNEVGVKEYAAQAEGIVAEVFLNVR